MTQHQDKVEPSKEQIPASGNDLPYELPLGIPTLTTPHKQEQIETYTPLPEIMAPPSESDESIKTPQKKGKIPKWAMIAGPLALAGAVFGGIVGFSGGSSDKVHATASFPHEKGADKQTSTTTTSEQQPIAHPDPVIPNSSDVNERIQQIFTNINNGYKTGDVSYLNYAFAGGSSGNLGAIFSQNIQNAQLKANNYATVYGRDPDGPKRLDIKVLASDVGDPNEPRYLIELTEVGTLGSGEKLGTPRDFVYFLTPTPAIGPNAMTIRRSDEITDNPNEVSQIQQNPMRLESLAS
jgi:hypothetical protein